MKFLYVTLNSKVNHYCGYQEVYTSYYNHIRVFYHTFIRKDCVVLKFTHGIVSIWLFWIHMYNVHILVNRQEDFWGRVSGLGCSITGAHTDPKLNMIYRYINLYSWISISRNSKFWNQENCNQQLSINSGRQNCDEILRLWLQM